MICPVLFRAKRGCGMRRTEMLQEIRKMRFEEAYKGWHAKRLTQAEAASLLGVCERTFRRYLCRYEEEGLGMVWEIGASSGSHTARRRWMK